eukprot:1160281-Pelagomonas_calceolata.AAC.1
MHLRLQFETNESLINLPAATSAHTTQWTCSPHPVNFYKVEAHSGIIGNEGADASAHTAALTDTTDIALPDARDPFHSL